MALDLDPTFVRAQTALHVDLTTALSISQRTFGGHNASQLCIQSYVAQPPQIASERAHLIQRQDNREQPTHTHLSPSLLDDRFMRLDCDIVDRIPMDDARKCLPLQELGQDIGRKNATAIGQFLQLAQS